MSALAHTTNAQLLVQRAQELTGFLAQQAPEADELRRLPDAVVDALRAAELLSLGPPAALGGHGVDLDVMLEVGYVLGRGCTSTAWC